MRREHGKGGSGRRGTVSTTRSSTRRGARGRGGRGKPQPGPSNPGTLNEGIIGDVFEAQVRDLSAEGNGVIEHPSGRICFAPGVWPGERGQFKLQSLRGRSGLATLQTLLQASPERVAAPCAHHGHGAGNCGGCPWQFIAYTAQLTAKQQRVERAMARLGLQTANGEAVVAPILPSPQTLGYRNRAQLKTDGRELGYVAASSTELVPIRDCPILNPHNRETLQALRAQLPRRAWQPARGTAWRVLHIDDDINAEQVQPDVRRPFRQGNSAQNLRMQAWLHERLALLGPAERKQPALELFAGSGNFTAVLVEAGFTNIHAVEAVGEAIEALRARALPGVSVHALDLYSPSAPSTLRRALANWHTLLLDPPRDGLRTIADWVSVSQTARELLYISCNLATFSRDLGVLLDQGFTAVEIQPLDLFPHTPHVELMAHLQRK